MDDAVSARLLTIALLAVPLYAGAQSRAGLSDPTRPPPEILQPQSPGAVPVPSGPR